ncbi:hypothetical protein BDA96_02G046000 [Sorghum bicolor]|uniref:Uncharacterized protein n=2 Tax=Sorghum bicolor TaxID=4558 RepID=A0A921RK11_SORBI|nr:hypothetical protein BDA96_02G046000 [Sorghum bicolor]OQU88501.1 hypothetical protein SORBI_3002G046150 [Sorghum bicolor]
MPPDVLHDSAPCSHVVRGMIIEPCHAPIAGMDDELSPTAGDQPTNLFTTKPPLASLARSCFTDSLA